MVFLVTFKFILHLRTKRKPHSPVPLALLPIEGCRSAYNAPDTFQRCMLSIFSDFLEKCIEVFMDDFTVYVSSFDACLDSLDKVLNR